MRQSLDVLALDGELAKLLHLVDADEPFGTVASAARQVIERYAATEWRPAALFRGDWESRGRNGEFSTGWIETAEGIATDEERETLVAACMAMVFFVTRSGTPYHQDKHRAALADALREYLAYRHYDVTPPADKEKKAEGNGGGDSKQKNPPSPPDPAAARQAALEELRPADLKAYYSYGYAESKLGATTDRQAYQWLKENGLPDERELPELTESLADYKLPSLATWSKQIRNARAMLGEQKHTRRAGRAAGSRSIVASRELDKSEDAD